MVWILKIFIFIYKFILNSDADVKLMLTARLAINEVQSQMGVKLPHYNSESESEVSSMSLVGWSFGPSICWAWRSYGGWQFAASSLLLGLRN